MFFIKKLQKKNARNEQLFNKRFKIHLKLPILYRFEEFAKLLAYMACRMLCTIVKYDILISIYIYMTFILFIYIGFYYMFYLLHYRPKTSPFVAYKRMFESSWEYADGPGGGFSSKSRQCLTYIVQKICSNPNW